MQPDPRPEPGPRETSDDARRQRSGCLAGMLVLISAILGTVVGAVAGGWWALESARGRDAIFHPIFWAVPLGAILGAIAAAVLAAMFAASRER